MERDAVVCGRLLLVLEFGLRDSGAEGDVPQRRSVGLVRLAPLEVAQERTLGGELSFTADGAVGQAPIDAEAEGAPEILELLLVFRGEFLAQLDEVAARDGQLVGSLG